MADSAPHTPPSHQSGDDDNNHDGLLSPTQPVSSSRAYKFYGDDIPPHQSGNDNTTTDTPLQASSSHHSRAYKLYSDDIPPHTPPSHQSGDDDTTTDAPLQASSSQPLSSRFDRWPNNDTCTIDDICTTSDAEDHDEGCMIDLVARPGQAIWEVEGLARHTPDLKMDFYVDTTDRTAFFSIRGQCTLKTGTPATVSLFLFIYPENVQSLEVSYTSSVLPHTEEQEAVSNMDRFIRLRFIMTQLPSLVAPKDRPLQPKHRSEALLDALHSLATVKDVSFYLDLSYLPIETRAQLALLPSIFSPAKIRNRPRTYMDRASLVRLYGGAGGQVVNPRPTACEPADHEVQEAQPGSPTHTTGVLQDAAQTSTQTRKRSASASELLPRYIIAQNERVLAGPSYHRCRTSEIDSESEESTQPRSPSDPNGKRPRLATLSDLDLPPLPPSPTVSDFLAGSDPSILSCIRRQFLVRNAALERLLKQLLTRNEALETRAEQSSKLEDWVKQELREQVGGEIARQLRKLRRKTRRKWANEIRAQVREEIIQDFKEEMFEDVTKEVTKEVLKRMAGALVGAVDGSG